MRRSAVTLQNLSVRKNLLIFHCSKLYVADPPPGTDYEDESLEEQLGLGRSTASDAPVHFASSSTGLGHSSSSSHPPQTYGDSKFAQLLGFGFFRGEQASPLNMGSLEIDSEAERPPPEEEAQQQQQRPSTTAPLEPSFYQIGMRMADTQVN